MDGKMAVWLIKMCTTNLPKGWVRLSKSNLKAIRGRN